MMKRKYRFGLLILFLTFSACQSLKPYQRVYVDDKEMQLGNSPSKDFSSYVHSIREGATPASGSKSSGGCGCN